ncbi:MAG: S8 family serine peptidase [Methanomassiliicoccales archaeon]|jgi:subtilisin
MNTIRITINNLLQKIGFGNQYYGVDCKNLILEIKDEVPSDHVDWVIRHGGFDKLGYHGKGERISVLDTGCDIGHKDLIGKVSAACFINGCTDNPPYLDNLGHGTFCMGEIVANKDEKGVIGVAYEATGFAGKVLYGDGRDGSMSMFENALANGIRMSVAEGCGVISMSLGSKSKSNKIQEALAFAVDSGVIPFAASGNEGLDGSLYASYPASYKDCISVAAADSNDLPAWFSTAGLSGTVEEQPELAIASLEYYWGCLPGSKYGKMIGTSMSCPMAAGVALLWRQAMREKGLLGAGREIIGQYREWIQRVSNDINKNGWDAELGWGTLLLDPNEMP